MAHNSKSNSKSMFEIGLRKSLLHLLFGKNRAWVNFQGGRALARLVSATQN